ncbi:MAG: HU family DNA-binding protein [bacterium]|nr:HU family DNA-binding protein [bacterium]MDZ4296635.1 HU family DNA-binding protein [Patescibacteria group bacterium]
MNKDALSDAVATRLGVSKAETMRMLETAMDVVTQALAKGEEVSLTGFGTFTISSRAARQGINPRTGEKIQIAAVKVPKFRAGKALKDAVK